MFTFTRTYQTFPYLITDMDGTVCELKEVLSWLEDDIVTIHKLAEPFITHEMLGKWQEYVDNGYKVYDSKTSSKNSKESGRRLGIRLDEGLKSRFTQLARTQDIVQTIAIDHIKSWQARIETIDGKRYSSRGYKRTVSDNKPTLGKPYIPASCVNKQFSYIDNNPIEDGFIDYVISIGTKGKFHLFFPLEKDRV